MKPISCIFFLVLILTLWPRRTITTAADSGSHIIDRACESTQYKDLCKASIKAHCDDGAAPADFHGVAKIAVKVAYFNATDTHEYMEELLGAATEAFVHQSLMDCAATYDDAIGNLEESVAAMESGEYDYVQTSVEAAMVDPQTCEEYFKEIPGHTSPLTSRNTILVQLCSNALAITKLAATGSAM